MDMNATWGTPASKRRVAAFWFREQRGICWLCKSTELPLEPYQRDRPHNPIAATIEHLVPRRDGGPNTVGNARVAHAACNSALGTLWEANRQRAERGEPELTEAWALGIARARMLQEINSRQAEPQSVEHETSAGIAARGLQLQEALKQSLEYRAVPMPRAGYTITSNHRRAHMVKRAKAMAPSKGTAARSMPLPRGATLPGFTHSDVGPPPPITPQRAPPASQIFDNRAPRKMKETIPEVPLCAKCGSDKVRMDAQLTWDPQRRTWTTHYLRHVFDCEVCEDETTIRWGKPPATEN